MANGAIANIAGRRNLRDRIVSSCVLAIRDGVEVEAVSQALADVAAIIDGFAEVLVVAAEVAQPPVSATPAPAPAPEAAPVTAQQ